MHCVCLALWTRKVLCGNFYAAYIHFHSFIHSHRTVTSCLVRRHSSACHQMLSSVTNRSPYPKTPLTVSKLSYVSWNIKYKKKSHTTYWSLKLELLFFFFFPLQGCQASPPPSLQIRQHSSITDLSIKIVPIKINGKVAVMDTYVTSLVLQCRRAGEEDLGEASKREFRRVPSLQALRGHNPRNSAVLYMCMTSLGHRGRRS